MMIHQIILDWHLMFSVCSCTVLVSNIWVLWT